MDYDEISVDRARNFFRYKKRLSLQDISLYELNDYDIVDWAMGKQLTHPMEDDLCPSCGCYIKYCRKYCDNCGQKVKNVY